MELYKALQSLENEDAARLIDQVRERLRREGQWRTSLRFSSRRIVSSMVQQSIGIAEKVNAETDKPVTG